MNDLHEHLSSIHGATLCFLCLQYKRGFLIKEHEIYSNKLLYEHLDKDHRRCRFCKVNVYDERQLYYHTK